MYAGTTKSSSKKWIVCFPFKKAPRKKLKQQILLF
jgi:hypothetical protein